ncbi:hypothetical protein [Deinococcus rufus]|uniref:Uncharacterized protein n=1 Tax=Deinococcus rufus TaxID=2136097 RepID=A0ABV7Z905_9DEIO
MYNDVQNTDNLEATQIDLTGGYRLFFPDKLSEFYDSATKKPIHLGHVRAPAETYTPTTKTIPTNVYGAQQTVLEVTTATVETGTFETISSKNALIRGLWAGSKAVAAGAPTAAAFQANHAYALGDLVTPTTPNGHYYEVTAAGTTSGTEPTGWKTDGTTNTSGTVVFTDQGLVASSGLVLIARNHATYTGMLVDVVVSALDRTTEIYVAPNITLRGDGYGGGRNSTDETSLKFAYTVLAPAPGYTVPATIAAAFATQLVKGGYDILGITQGQEDAVIDKIKTGYYA